jgi:uncharacterized protein YcbK (DUF882 family)
MRTRALRWASLAAFSALALAFGTPAALAEIRSLTLHNLHTEEAATIVFKRDGVYDKDGLAALNHFLRDWREDKVIEMDPHLYDLVWEVYRQTGSNGPIQIICGYRSPETNEALRANSDGVAENSLHMRGHALDFYIPGVSVATLRAIGLRMQAGGVGFYPSSSSPFVHLDTGSVRHWPAMTRQQLLTVFPDGKALNIPSDGKPLPGYQQALAEYQARQAKLTPVTQVASFTSTSQRPLIQLASARSSATAPVVQTASAAPSEQTSTATRERFVDQFIRNVASIGGKSVSIPATKPAAPVARAAPAPASRTEVASAPLPNLAPRPEQTQIAALASSPDSVTLPAGLPSASAKPPPATGLDFNSPDLWQAPVVSVALASAMATRELGNQLRAAPGASLPIAPTAVVATVKVDRVLGAEAITNAVIRGQVTAASVSPVLAYAADLPPTPAASLPPSAPAPSAAPLPPLTLTALDTSALRLWMGSASTRQRGYALLTMPEFTAGPALLEAQVSSASGGFLSAGDALRTDRFTPAAQ